ncbi:YhgE/Pip domain-containing protein [Paenibacillus pinihumi]|uniref:YhgE/Pip domain-containing protein n=1 Tax=Paenibacillus pinihumi TaxID=669462 RepID=UPI000429DC5F|nr:ABC transporter permease [Paenibacillus pinihumi]
MKNALQAFLKRPTTIVGMVTAIMFQLIFSVIWMTGYSGVSERIDRLHVSILNEDKGETGAVIAGQLAEILPVQITKTSTLEEAQQLLDERKLQMIIRIPAEFSAGLSASGEAAKLDYFINESNPSMIKSVMTTISSQVTAAVNKQAIANGSKALLSSLHLPEQTVNGASDTLSERVAANVTITNPVEGTNSQMVPMMMVLASYVGAMIMAMNFEQSAMAISAHTGKWRRFAVRSLLNVIAAVVVSLVGSSLVYALGGQMVKGFLAVWGLQFSVVLTFMFVSQFFILLLGMAGMLLNIIVLSVQLVTSGAMIPRQLLPDFYIGLGKLLPATYSVEGYMDLLFGGTGAGRAVGMLGVILVIALLLSFGAVALRRDKRVDVPGHGTVATN